MFFWLIAIPFFVIIAMFTLFRLPSSGLHEPEDIQDTAMAFRMVLQHDAAAKLMQEYKATGESDMFDEGSYDLGGDEWKETILSSGYIPSSFIPDTDNITTYIRCLNGLRQITSCRGATGIYMVTAATPPSGSSITTRWFEKKGAENLASQLKKYEGSFPVKQSGLVLPKKPRKQEDESDEAFAIRLNEYKEAKAQYKLLKRNYYDFGTNLPRPNTTAGQVRAYPFGEESADSRVIVQRIKAIEGDVVFDKEYMPTDLPSGGEGSDSMDFNGEAVIFTASGSCNGSPCACTKGTDCGAGVYCLSGTCSSGCGTYGFDANRTCYTTCTSDSQCPEGYFCDSGLCEEILPFEPGTVVYEVKDIRTPNLSSAVQQVGTYTIPATGKYQVRLMGESAVIHSNTIYNHSASGGILIANKEFSADTVLIMKGVKGGYRNSDEWGGAGVMFWDTVDTSGVPVLVAGGGGRSATGGGGGINGGWQRYRNTYSWIGYSYTGNLGDNQSYCDGNNSYCNTAGGGSADANPSTYVSAGGTGSSESDCISAGFSNCAMIAGGNSRASTITTYLGENYGNWVGSTTIGDPGYAAIVYCGPRADSACPASCDVNTACTTGTCNYHTGLCE